MSSGACHSVAAKCHEALQHHVSCCTNKKLRSWLEKASSTDADGKGKTGHALQDAEYSALGQLLRAKRAGKLALSVAVTAKAVWIKLPKCEDSDAKSKVVKATKQHLLRAALGKVSSFIYAICMCLVTALCLLRRLVSLHHTFCGCQAFPPELVALLNNA